MTRHATAADYTRLGVPTGATDAEVKSAFRKLALRYHPDRNPDNPEATRHFRLVVESYDAILQGPPPPRTPAHTRPMHPGSPQTAPPPNRPHPVFRPMVEAIPKPLAALDVGDVVWTDYAAILVGPDRSCYLDPADLGRPHVDRGTQVRVERRFDGYHVTLPPNCRHRWTVSSRAAGAGLAIAALNETTAPLRTGGFNPLMPGHLLDSVVSKMEPGQRGWTIAAALVVQPNGSCFIDGSEHVNDQPTLTTPVRVERRNDGWHVVADGHPKRWAEQALSLIHI